MSAGSINLDLRAIPLDMLRRYLIAHAWKPDPSVRKPTPPEGRAAQLLLQRRKGGSRNFELYVSTAPDFRDIELVVPLNKESSEYELQVHRILQTLSSVEERSDTEIAASIRQIGFDIVQSKIPDSYVVDETIHLSRAESFITGIRNVLASLATTELKPDPFYLRMLKEGSEFADRCRFAHTFRGSFGFTIESPLEPYQPELPEMQPKAPFERRVIQRLVRGLQHVDDAVKEDSTGPIVRSSRDGLNANVCEFLATLVEQTAHSSMVFKFSLSPEWRAEDPLMNGATFTLGAAHVEVVRSAAKQMRSMNKSSEETIAGRVIRLASQIDPSDLTDYLGNREVAISWASPEMGDINVHASLTPYDYLRAVEAHGQGRQIRLSGTLERRGRKWVLLNPSDFDLPN